MGPKQCQVCNQAQSKYKCPSCLAPYCSLLCFKKHKEIPCAMPVSIEEKSSNRVYVVLYLSAADPELLVERPLNVDEPGEVLQKLRLESIACSSEIRNALKDEHLKKIIYHIDCSQDPENELDKAMEDEVFQIFTNKILSAIGP